MHYLSLYIEGLILFIAIFIYRYFIIYIPILYIEYVLNLVVFRILKICFSY